jgi:hypothetical protein
MLKQSQFLNVNARRARRKFPIFRQNSLEPIDYLFVELDFVFGAHVNFTRGSEQTPALHEVNDTVAPGTAWLLSVYVHGGCRKGTRL